MSMIGDPVQQRNNHYYSRAAVPTARLRSRRHDRRIRLGYGLRYRNLRWKKQWHPLKARRNRIHEYLRGSPAACIAADAVRNDEKVAEPSAGVTDRALVVLANLSAIALAGEANGQGLCSGHIAHYEFL
jgi:hypothetical protein